MKNILIVLPLVFYRNSGSSLSSFYRLKALSKAGYKMDVITYPDGDDVNDDNIKIIRSLPFKFFSYVQPGEYKKKIIYDFFVFIRSLFYIIFRRPDIVYIHSSGIYYVLFLKLFALRKMFIANVDNYLESELGKWEVTKKNRLKRFLNSFEVFALKRYNKIVASYLSVKQHYEKYIQADKISVIYNTTFIHEEKYEVEKSELFTVVYAGSFVEVQNLKLLIESAKYLTDWEDLKIIIIGGIPEEIKKLEELKQENNIGDLVEILARMPRNEVKKYLIKADILASPRTFGHDTPMKIFEYLALGKCILASDRKIHTQLLNSENSFLAEPTPKDFAEAVLYLKDNPKKLKQISEKASKFFEDKLSFNRMVNEYKELIESINQ